MSEHHAIDLDVTHARQARRGRHAFVILVASLALVVVALLGTWAFYYGGLAGQHGNREAPASVARSVTQEPAPAKQSQEG